MAMGRFVTIGISFAVLLQAGTTTSTPFQARRVVDVVTVGDSKSEQEHDYAGEQARVGFEDGRIYREALGWQRYTLTVFEDTEVTVVCVFRGSEGQARRYALEVEGRSVPVVPFRSPSADPVTIEIRVPLAVTRNRTLIAITLRAVDGPTPGLMQIRTVQEHLEVETTN